MERQLKERLIGAAVLVAVAVIMVPEMFSGSGSNHASQDQSATSAGSSESGQIKTYRIELQHRDGAASSESTVQPPPVAPDNRLTASSVSASPQAGSSDVASMSASSTGAVARGAVSVQTPVMAPRSSASSSAVFAQAPSATNFMAGWSVQLGSFAAESTAKQMTASAKSHDFPVYLASVKVGGKILYRVRVGPYEDRGDAEAALGKLKRSYAQASLVAPNH